MSQYNALSIRRELNMTQTIRLESSNTAIPQLPDSLQHLVFLLSQTKELTSYQVHQSLEKAQIQQADLMPWATFDHPITHSYGRQLVYDGGYFEIMVMSWVLGDISAIHDHGATQWGAVQCFGKASHWAYQLDGQTLQTQEFREFSPGQIVRVNHDLIHQMGNCSQDSFLTLHVYGISHEYPSITGDARVFDLFEQSIQYTDGGVFFCLPEADIDRKTFGLNADNTSKLRHHQQMRSRVGAIIETSPAKLEYWQTKAIKLDREISRLGNIAISN
ncbi:putative metal-dependent enzyme of the double-stranded beta helix superfamily [Xenococcus sp. PCC 7305]|nr:putative metal-dependent enzyme of the double-stranded beta helix superfamily [Xenococcus sp. PCC 7305]